MGNLFLPLGKLCRPRSGRSTRRPALFRGTKIAKNRNGSTLVELVIAVALVGVLAAIGWGLMSSQLATYRMMRVARMMQSDLSHLRALSVATNREARLHLVTCDDTLDPYADQLGYWELQLGNRAAGSTSWDTLPPDDEGVVVNGEGIRDLSPSGDRESPGVSLADWGELDGPGGDSIDSIVFSPRGWLSNTATDFHEGYITLRIVNKRALRDGRTEEVRVRIARSGMAALERSDATSLPDGTVGTGEASTR